MYSTGRAALSATVVVAVGVPVLATAQVALPGAVGTAVQTGLALAFVLTVPGRPLAILLRLREPLLSFAVMVAISVASVLVVATALVTARWWHPLVLGWGLAAVHLAATWPADRVLAREAAQEELRRRQEADEQARADAEAARAAREEARKKAEQEARRRAGRRRRQVAAARSRNLVPEVPPPLGGRWGQLASAAPQLLPLLALAGALELWLVATRTVALDGMGASGLISAVGGTYVGAVLLVAVVAALQLVRERPDPAITALSIVALVVLLFGFANVTDSAAGFRTAWIHVGFIRYISQHGAVATGFDARFSWPGFFAAAATLVRLAHLPDASGLLRWAPVGYNLLALPAVLVIGRALTADVTAAWLGAFAYYCFNWFSQDYLSPQATVFLLYVTMAALLLRTTAPTLGLTGPLVKRLYAEARRLPDRAPGLSMARGLACELVLLLLGVATVVSHQLTPVTMIAVLFVFAVSGGTRYRLLWLLVALAFLSWFSFGAADFWRGHLSTVFGDVGQLGATLGSSVGARLHGNAAHGRMQEIRLLWSAGSLALAAIGLWLRRSAPRLVPAAALAYAPFGLLAVQSYGGEVALRSFVYAEPAVAPLAALTVLTGIRLLPRAPLRAAALAMVLVIGGLALTATRGANEGFERVTASNVSVARSLLSTMPAGSRIGLFADAGPLGLEHLTDFTTVDLGPDTCGPDLVLCTRRRRPDYLYVTTTQDVLGQLDFSQPPGWTTAVVNRLVALRLYRRTWWADGTVVLKRRSGPLLCPCLP